MFRGPSFIVSTMQEETTPIFKRLWYDWTQQQPGIEPTNPLGQCWVPPIVAFYDQQGLLRTYSLPGGSIRSPHPRAPRGLHQEPPPWTPTGWPPLYLPFTTSTGYWEPILPKGKSPSPEPPRGDPHRVKHAGLFV